MWNGERRWTEDFMVAANDIKESYNMDDLDQAVDKLMFYATHLAPVHGITYCDMRNALQFFAIDCAETIH